ncbi:MAG: hypothetical protein J1E83_11865 [Lachnospiraceae bacterium]|nr:hypothetical protein [Lachnospiraceae bacterium]
MGYQITDKLILLGVLLLTGLLSFLFGRRTPKYPGMAECLENPFLHFFVYAWAIFMIAFAAFIATITFLDKSAWEEAGGRIIEVFSLMFLITVFLIALGVISGKHYIYYNQEKLILGRVFSRDLTLSWYEISKVRVNKTGRRIRLYNREGKRILNAHSLMTNFDQFYHTVVQKLGSRVMYE